MPLTVRHALSMTTPDNTAFENKPSNWNATHLNTMNASGSEISGAFTNAGGITWGLSANGRLSGTVKTDYLTTAAFSNHSHGNPLLALTNLSGTTASNSAGLTLSLSAAQTGVLTQTHDSAHHSGTIFPPNVDQALGSAFLQFAVTAEPANAPAGNIRLYAIDQNGHPVVEAKGPAGLTRRLGRDSIIIARVDEAGGVVVGEAVYISGAVGANESIQKARADSDATMPAIGLVLETGAFNDFVRVLFSGKATELNTVGFTVGDRVFVSAVTAGALTTTPPAHPNLRQRVGIVSRAHATQGEIIVTPHILRGDHEGTNKNAWLVGDAAAGAKSVNFVNGNTGALAWNPSANRALSLPDADGFLALSTHSHGDPTLALTNLSGTTASNSAGLTLSLSAGAGGAGDGGNVLSAGTRLATTLGTVLFSNENGVSFGLDAPNGTRMTASVAAQSVQPGIQSVSAGTTRVTTGEVVFSNLNGVSFGANGQTITGSVATSLSNILVSAGTTSNLLSAITFANANGISFGLNASTLTGSHNGLTSQSNQALSAANGSFTFQTAQFHNSHGISWSTTTGSGIIASHNGLTSQSNQAASGSNGSFTFQTLGFSNANGISFGTSAGSSITASHNALTTAALSNHSHGVTLNLTNLSGTTGGNSNGITISLSAAAPGGGGGALSAGTTSGTLGTVVLSNSNNVTFGMNGQTITATAAGGAAAQPARRWAAPQGVRFGSMALITNITAISSRPFFWPFFHDAGDLTISRVNYQMSRSTSGSNHFSVHFGIYTYVNDTQISLLGSVSGSYSNTATASISGVRRFAISGLPAAISTLSPGGYVLGMMFKHEAGSSASMNYSLMGGQTVSPVLGAILEGADQYNTATSFNFFPFLGRLTGNSSVLPGSVADSHVIGQFTGASHFIQPWVGLNND